MLGSREYAPLREVSGAEAGHFHYFLRRLGDVRKFMARRMLRRAEGTDDRRAYNRLAIEREVRYKVFGVKKTVKTVGSGRTIDMSSGGLLISTESALTEGDRVELAVSWPAQLNDAIPLKLVAHGRVVRAEETKAAIIIEKHEFRTRGSGSL